MPPKKYTSPSGDIEYRTPLWDCQSKKKEKVLFLFLWIVFQMFFFFYFSFFYPLPKPIKDSHGIVSHTTPPHLRYDISHIIHFSLFFLFSFLGIPPLSPVSSIQIRENNHKKVSHSPILLLPTFPPHLPHF